MKRSGSTCGGKRGWKRPRKSLFRREEKALPPLKAPKTSNDLLDSLKWAVGVLSHHPPPWEPDIDEPVRDLVNGRIVDGFWTGKFYTGRRGSLCMYLDGNDGVSTAATALALAEVRNALPELLRLAAIGAEAESKK